MHRDPLCSGLRPWRSDDRSSHALRRCTSACRFDKPPQKLENVRFTAEKPLETDAVKVAIAEAEAALSGQGRLLVRASGTEKLIRVMAEGDDEALVKRVVADVACAVRAG